jgi:hypothetical protein
VAPARESNGHLLRALKAAFEIENGQNYDIVLAAGWDSTLQASGGAATTGYELVYTLGHKIKNIGELQLNSSAAVTAQSRIQSPSQEGRDAAPLSARQERTPWDGQHDSPRAARYSASCSETGSRILKTFA